MSTTTRKRMERFALSAALREEKADKAGAAARAAQAQAQAGIDAEIDRRVAEKLASVQGAAPVPLAPLAVAVANASAPQA